MDNQEDNSKNFVKFAEQILSESAPKSIDYYALESLLGFMKKECVESLNAKSLKLWIATMIIRDGKKVGTGKRYFGKAHSIFSDYSVSSDDDPFAEVSNIFDSLKDSNSIETGHNFEKAKHLFSRNESSQEWKITNIFFYLLYLPASSISNISNLTFDSAERFCPQIDDIIDSFDSSHGRKYVFELKQGKSRPNEIAKHIIDQLQDLLRGVGMKFSDGFSRASITAMWIYAAIKAKISIEDIRSCIGSVPEEYSALSIIDKTEISDVRKKEIICKVADSINSYAKRWFVMKLRRGVSYNDVREEIQEKLPGRLNSMELFYPTRKESHREGKKIITEEIPFLPDLLFFKTPASKVKSLFAAIGDAAWCFRITNNPDSAYSVISHREMQSFQRCIGQFTSDIRIDLVDNAKSLKKGNKVRITGGIMNGYEGEILDIEGSPGERIFFLSISNDMQLRWEAYVEDAYIKPLETNVVHTA